MSAGAYKSLGVTLSDKFHFFVAYRTAGIGVPGYCFTISAFPVLAYKHFPVFSVYFQHKFPALGALMAGQIIVAESAVCIPDIPDKFLCIILDLVHKFSFRIFPPGNGLQAQLPPGCQLRAFQIRRDQRQQLSPL